MRRARPGETLRTLDGVERQLEPTDLMIADADRAIALAGIMGGEETEIGESTTEVLLEAANFEPYGIFRSSERLRLRTEGSNRWEKGVDPYLAEQAAKLATQLLTETAGARWVGHSDVIGELPERPVIRYRPQRADEVIGLPTPPEEQLALLGKLGFERHGDDVIAPTWRARDVTREIDVVEEVARFRLDEVPFTLPARRAMFGRSLLSSGSSGASKTSSPASAWSRPTLPRSGKATRTPVPGASPSRSRSSSPSCEPACCRAWSTRLGAISSWELGESRCSSSRMSTGRTESYPTSTGTSPESSREAGAEPRASSRRSTRR